LQIPQGESYNWVCITPSPEEIHLELENRVFTESEKKKRNVTTQIFKTMIENG